MLVNKLWFTSAWDHICRFVNIKTALDNQNQYTCVLTKKRTFVVN